jgi:hypothetical protein
MFNGGGSSMGWTLLAIVFFTLGGLFVNLLMRMSAEADRKARHAQHRMDPFSDVTITRLARLQWR